MKNVLLVNHPLVKELVTKLRDFGTNSEHFRHYTKVITGYLVYEALSKVKLKKKTVVTQTKGEFDGFEYDEKIKFFGVLREGVGMILSSFENFSCSQFDLVGVKRNDDDPFNQPAKIYYGNFNNIGNFDRVVIMDQMFATGSTMLIILDEIIKKHNFKGKVDIVSIIVARFGAETVLKRYPNINITCAGLDDKLTENGYIYPGLGDASDRYFNAVENKKL